jgi:hypothetical protein
MSDPGEREDAPEFEEIEDVADETSAEDEQSDGAGSDEDGADEGDGDEGSDADDQGGKDPAGDHEGQTRGSSQVKPRSAATVAVQEAKRIAREAKERADRVEAELQRLQQERQGRTQAEQQAEERARLELMSPDEKVDYLLKKQEQGFSSALNQLRFEQADSKDQTRFDAVCARKPHFAAIADEVEAELQKMRRNGATAPRETIALYLIGKKADERASKGVKTKQAARGAARVGAERVSAPSGRSDVRGGAGRRGGDEKTARRTRLEDQQI